MNYTQTSRKAITLFGVSLLCFAARGQEADISKMGHRQLRSYLKENGWKSASGTVIHVGDTLYIGKGTMPDKRFTFIYQAVGAFGSATSLDGSNKAYLNSNAVGKRAIVKSFFTSGMRKGEYAISVIVGVGEPVNYQIEVDNAVDAGEVKFSK